MIVREYNDEPSNFRAAATLGQIMEKNGIIGFAGVDPRDPAACEKLEDAFSRLKLKGLKLHPGRHHVMPSDPVMEPIYAICEKYNKPILFHAGLSWEPDTLTSYCQPLAFETVAAKHPRLRICLAHFGWPWVRETAMLMVKYPNVYTSAKVRIKSYIPAF